MEFCYGSGKGIFLWGHRYYAKHLNFTALSDSQKSVWHALLVHYAWEILPRKLLSIQGYLACAREVRAYHECCSLVSKAHVLPAAMPHLLEEFASLKNSFIRKGKLWLDIVGQNHFFHPTAWIMQRCHQSYYRVEIISGLAFVSLDTLTPFVPQYLISKSSVHLSLGVLGIPR